MVTTVAKHGLVVNLTSLTKKKKHWVIHQKSGYSLARLSPKLIWEFQKLHPELEENEVWDNLPGGCFPKAPLLGVEAVEKFRCYLHQALSIPTDVRGSYSCIFKTAAAAEEVQGNLPVLNKCTDSNTIPQCDLGEKEAAKAHVSLVEWMPPPELAKCTTNGFEMTTILERLETLFMAYNQIRGKKPLDAADTESEMAIAKEARKKMRWLKNTPCWRSAELAATVKPGCPLSPCLNDISMESFTKKLPKQFHKTEGDNVNQTGKKMQAAAAWFRCPTSGNCIGTLPFWNAHCRPLPRENFCVGLKRKYDDRCSENGMDEDDCREDKKKCYWPPAETDEGLGFCAAHKFKDDDDCADYRIQRGCHSDSDCFWVAGQTYETIGECKGHKFSNDKKCAKYRSDIGCNAEDKCFFLPKEADSQNEVRCTAKTPSDKKGKKCKDYRKQKCLEEAEHCTWQ